MIESCIRRQRRCSGPLIESERCTGLILYLLLPHSLNDDFLVGQGSGTWGFGATWGFLAEHIGSKGN